MGVSTGRPGTGWDSDHGGLGSEQHHGCGWGQLRVFSDRTEACGYLGRNALPPTSEWLALILELQLTHSHQGTKAWESGSRRSMRSFLSYPTPNTYTLPIPKAEPEEDLKPP